MCTNVKADIPLHISPFGRGGEAPAVDLTRLSQCMHQGEMCATYERAPSSRLLQKEFVLNLQKEPVSAEDVGRRVLELGTR